MPKLTEYEKKLKRIRNNRWYIRYHTLALELKEQKCENIIGILEAVDTLINDCRGYGYEWLAQSARESLNQVAIDLEVECEVCGGTITDDYTDSCPHCGSHFCIGCETFVEEYDIDRDMCTECVTDSLIAKAEANMDRY